MLVVFVTNYYNHHQSSFSEAMYRFTDGNYFFVENEPMSTERKNMGWGENIIPSYVIQAYKDEETRQHCIDLINSAEVVLFENTTKPLVVQRLKAGKLTFLYSERIFKEGYEYWKLPYRRIKWKQIYNCYQNYYLLCSSAYTAADFALTGNFIGKSYKWGYFPKVFRENIDELRMQKNRKEKVSILWVARLIEWKHPDASIQLAKMLKKKGYSFDLDLIGIGPLEGKLKEEIKKQNLNDCVHLLGAMSPQEVRNHMRMADIFLFTSDFNEGWGAVLNEAMNSACAIVASHAIGSVPYLIEDEKNGLIYKNGDMKDLAFKVEELIKSPSQREQLGRAAYDTVAEMWNAENAAQRLLQLSEDLLRQGKSDRFKFGPCSKAEIRKNNWYKKG